MITPFLAYRLFLDPLPLESYWMFLLVPLVAGISVTYKTIKLDNLAELPKQATFLFLQIIVFMVLAAACLWLITEIA